MNTNKFKKNSTTEIKEKFKKSKFDLLTNENDFLVKNLKKAGWSTRDLNIFQTINYLNFFPKKNIIFLNDHPKKFKFVKYKISIKYTN